MRPEITGELEQLIEDAVESGPYRTKGEFVRDACRHHLDRINADNERSLESLAPPADRVIPTVPEPPRSELPSLLEDHMPDGWTVDTDDVVIEYDKYGKNAHVRLADHAVERELARERVEE